MTLSLKKFDGPQYKGQPYTDAMIEFEVSKQRQQVQASSSSFNSSSSQLNFNTKYFDDVLTVKFYALEKS